MPGAAGGANGADLGKTPQVSGAPANGQSASTPAANGRQIVRTATVNLKAADVPDAVTKIRKAATDVGGYSSDENAGDDHGALTLKVPADKLEPVLDKIGSYGRVASRVEHAEDVTDEMVDVTSRLATQRASVDRVRALMDKASSLGEVTQIESELTKREADLESLEQRHDALAAQIAMSTITVDVSKTDAPPPPQEEQASFLSALGAGWRALVATINGIGVGLGAVLPFALVIGIPAAAVYVLIRRRKARPETP
ncbi:DUF4349 domain-containing protein [Kutzneria sp. NPDC052558]|uniref:DUF4349 domain-containing protein n=1 Tax=Kutzneria sp. NPDC052558 TaxID=3364121 RepID=UPI0037CA3A1E